uniref:RRM domain-containing protein n=1 Tax=Taenia asiatica TaxID=60517 RepID=A0A0R3W7P6_TAEAS
LEPCLIARPSQSDVRCFRCDKVYPRKSAVHNEVLERLVTQRFVEERRSLVTTCNACQHPAPILRDCQHCQLRVCSSCWDSHYAKVMSLTANCSSSFTTSESSSSKLIFFLPDHSYEKVVASVTKSMRELLKGKKNLEEIRGSLKPSSCGQGPRLKDGIEEATSELEDACDKSLDLSTANLVAFFTGYLDELVALKGAVMQARECIIGCVYQKTLLPQMALGGLLDLREKLKCVGVRAACIHERVDKCKEKPKLHVEHSLTSALETLSLIDVTDYEDDDAQSSCQDEVSEVDSVVGGASTGKQVFVGGVSRKIDHIQLRKYFSRYGSVKNSYVSHHRGFGCITFESEESVLSATFERFQIIEGTRVEVKEYIKRKYVFYCATFFSRAALKAELPKNTAPPPQLWEHEKVYIGGISANTTKASLQSALSQFGPVTKLDMVPQRGFGVVVFTDPQKAELAIARHWLDVDGKRVELLPFVPDKEARNALARSGHKPSVPTEPTNMSNLKSNLSPSLASPSPPAPPLEAEPRVFVGGISWNTTANSLTSALSKLGPVRRVDIFPKRGFAVVVFEKPKTADVAISVHWYMVDDKMVELRPFVPNNNSVKSTGKQETLSRVASTSSVGDTPGPTGDQPLEDISSRTLYVDGIGKSISESALKIYFSSYGDVKQCQITGQCGRLVFGRPQDLQNALKTQSNYLNGQRLVLIPASSEKHKISDSGVTHASAVSSMINARKLLIRGVGEGTTHAVLRDYFVNYGPVDYASVIGTEAWVVFKNAKTVNLVLATQPHFIRGRQIILSKPDEGDASPLGPPTPPPVGISGASGNAKRVLECLFSFRGALLLSIPLNFISKTAPLLGPLFNPVERSSSPRRVESSNALSSKRNKGSALASRKQLSGLGKLRKWEGSMELVNLQRDNCAVQVLPSKDPLVRALRNDEDGARREEAADNSLGDGIDNNAERHNHGPKALKCIGEHTYRQEISVGVGSVVLKPMIWANCASGDEFTCQHCGESYSEADDDSSSSPNAPCLFCRRFHMCGTFVAILSTAIEFKVGVQDGSMSVKVFGAFLMARESNLWEFEKIIGAEEDLSLEAIEEKPSKSMRWSLAYLSVEFLPPRLSKSKFAVNVNLLRQPIEKSLTLTSEVIRFTSGAENLSLNVGNLKLLSGRIDGTHEASRELAIERVDVCASLTEDKVDAALTVSGIFGGFAQDADESVFFQSLHSGLRSIAKSHKWLAPGHKASYGSSYSKTMEEKYIHTSVYVEPSRNQKDCAVRVAWLAAANAVPALVGSIGLTKLDVTLPSAATESFSFVLETSGFQLNAITPKWSSAGNNEVTGEPRKEREESFTSSPISDVLMESELKYRLVKVAQFSTWCHVNVVGFRISEVEVEMPSVMLANMHRQLGKVVVGVGGVTCSGGRGRRSGWFRRRWFSTAAVTSMNRFTLDGHFEAFHLAFLASCGACIECEVPRAHCSASALPRCSPSRTPLSSAATTAPLLQQQQSSMPPPLFLEFSVSGSDFRLRLPDTSTSSMPPTSLIALPAFQVCCSLSQRSVEVSLCEPVELRVNPGAHLCVVEFLLLTRRFLGTRRSSEAVDTATPSTVTVTTSWNVEVRNTATTRLTYSSGCHSAAAVFSTMNVYVGSASSHLSLRVKSPKLVLFCDGREIAVFQNFVLRRLPASGAHRKVAFRLITPENTCL